MKKYIKYIFVVVSFACLLLLVLFYFYFRYFLKEDTDKSNFILGQKLSSMIQYGEVSTICHVTGVTMDGEKINEYSVTLKNNSEMKISFKEFEECGEICKNFIKNEKFGCSKIIN